MKPKFLFLVGVMLLSLHTFSQTTQHTIHYANTGLTNDCNVFNTSTPVSIDGYKHYPVYGGAGIFNNTLLLKCQNGTSSATKLGAAYAIEYPFKSGYLYRITGRAWKAAGQPTTGIPQLAFTTYTTLPTPVSGTPTACDAIRQSFWGSMLLDSRSAVPLNDSQDEQVFCEFNADQDFNYLSVLSWGGASNMYTLAAISEITITEIAPRFTLSPTSLTKDCGQPLSQLFQVTDVNSVGGITSYVWHLGPTPNGWLYNGQPAPDSITVTNLTAITLSADACSSVAPSPVSVTVYRDALSYQTDTATVQVSPLSATISGPAQLCSGVVGNYSFNGPLPCGATVTWSLNSGNNGSLGSITGDATTLTVNGNVTLTAHINAPCGNLTVSKSVGYSGKAPAPFGIAEEVFCQPGNIVQPSTFTAVPASDESYTWTWTSGNGTWHTISATTAEISNKFPVGSYTITATISNSCGSASDTLDFHIIRCATNLSGSDKVVVSPNPASSTLVVSTTSTSGTAKKQAASDESDIREVRITDKMGNLLRRQLFPAGTSHATINVEGLKPDVYILQTGNGKTFDAQQVVIAR
ncbi:PKD domain-containing protein [Chitinophaga ginsengisoli]|uniref:PKD domain-containing protein n=1 Tax=Chitinophaga ginsengisoli TaxID=363837 RepID=A0A2P8G2B0_9BACT|nr:hypothetical protein [Chitinophaga ginsengisoli]PSL28113.1 hypothetical protein CLV42_10832 [Chitinophaga ginsengisoli]